VTITEKWTDRLVRIAAKNTMAFDEVLQYMTDLGAAYIPREPKLEWFGTGKGQWPMWHWEGIGVVEFLAGEDALLRLQTEAGTTRVHQIAAFPSSEWAFPSQ